MTTIGGYELVDVIGRGSSGLVWRARPPAGGPDIALKVLFDNVAHDEQTARRFVASGRSLLDAPIDGAVRVVDVIDADGHLAVAMELIDSPSLRELLERGPLPLKDVAAIGSEVAATLGRAHVAGIVHRDIKPENILVSRESSTGEITALLSDFGIASSMEGRSTLTTTQPGTSAYTSPETFENSVPAPARDVYALGVVLYEMSSGARPFRAANPAALMREHLHAEPLPPTGMPPALWRLVAACLAKDPSRRPTASALSGALRGVASQAPAGVASNSADAATVARLPRSGTYAVGVERSHRQRGKHVALAMGLVLAAIASLGVAYVVGHRPAESEDTTRVASARTADPIPSQSLPTAPSPSLPTTSHVRPTSSPPTSNTVTPTPTRSKTPTPVRPPAPPEIREGARPIDNGEKVNPAPVIVDPPAPQGPKCPGADCNGAPPSAFGGLCRKDASVVDSSEGMGSAEGNLPQRLELFYSRKCQTAWARATVSADPKSLGYTVYVETTGGKNASTPVSSAPSYASVMVDLPRGDCVEASLFYRYQSRGRDPVELSNRWCAAG